MKVILFTLALCFYASTAFSQVEAIVGELPISSGQSGGLQANFNPKDPDSVEIHYALDSIWLRGYYQNQLVIRAIPADSAAYSSMLIGMVRRGGDVGGVNVRGYDAESADYQRLIQARMKRKEVVSTEQLEALWTAHTGLDWSWAMADFDSLYVGHWELLAGRNVIDTITIDHPPRRLRVRSQSHGNGRLIVFGRERCQIRGLNGFPRTTFIRRSHYRFADLDTYFALRRIPD